MQQVRLISPGTLSPGGSTGEVYAAGPYGARGEILISSRGKRSPLARSVHADMDSQPFVEFTL